MVRKVVASEEIEAWRAKCPLMLWMKARGHTGKTRGRGKKGLVLRIMEWSGAKSRMNVYSWLHGRSLPRPEKIARLRVRTGITLEAWLKWFYSKPREEHESCVTTTTASDSTAAGGET
jgi:hypothetical protein